MLSYLLLLSFINIIFAYERSCVSCKWFMPIPSNKVNNDLGLCKMFKNTCYNAKGKENLIHNFATHCRNDERLCGKSGFLYEAKDEGSVDVSETEIMNNYDELNELNNRCCGEVNEKDEIEQLEKDFFEIFQRIKKYNKKRIYNTSKDLYKLFKRND